RARLAAARADAAHLEAALLSEPTVADSLDRETASRRLARAIPDLVRAELLRPDGRVSWSTEPRRTGRRFVPSALPQGVDSTHWLQVARAEGGWAAFANGDRTLTAVVPVSGREAAVRGRKPAFPQWTAFAVTWDLT